MNFTIVFPHHPLHNPPHCMCWWSCNITLLCIKVKLYIHHPRMFQGLHFFLAFLFIFGMTGTSLLFNMSWGTSLFPLANSPPVGKGSRGGLLGRVDNKTHVKVTFHKSMGCSMLSEPWKKYSLTGILLQIFVTPNSSASYVWYTFFPHFQAPFGFIDDSTLHLTALGFLAWSSTGVSCFPFLELLCYAMLCYAMLCYAMLCYAMLCYAMLCYAMLCYAMLCYAMLCYAMLCYAMLCYAMLCYAMLCYAMLCYAMLCYAMLCYAMLCYALATWL